MAKFIHNRIEKRIDKRTHKWLLTLIGLAALLTLSWLAYSDFKALPKDKLLLAAFFRLVVGGSFLYGIMKIWNTKRSAVDFADFSFDPAGVQIDSLGIMVPWEEVDVFNNIFGMYWEVVFSSGDKKQRVVGVPSFFVNPFRLRQLFMEIKARHPNIVIKSSIRPLR